MPLPKKYAQENNFRTLAENIPGVIYLCNNDATNSMLYLNSKIEELTGYAPPEFITGKISLVQLYHPDDALRIFEAIEVALSNEESFHITYRIATKSGEWRWVEEVGTGIYEDDTLLFIEGFINDVTAQRLAEEKLKTVAEENYRIFNNSVSLSVIAGYDGYFKRLNPMWFRLFGWSEEEMLSRQIFEFIHHEDVDVTKVAVRHIADGNDLLTFENRCRCKDGSYKWLLWSSASDKKRKLIYASAIDISERKKFEEELLISKKNLERASEELQKQNDQLNEFAHIISHNLRSPVGNIQALISLLNTDSSKEEYALVFEKLKNTSLSLRRTLNDLLETLSIRKEGDGEKKILRFEDIFAHIKRDLEGEILTSKASIISNFDQCTEISYSKTYLESILLNLLSNALKYRSPDRTPQISVTTTIKNDRKILQVTDNGLGIDLDRFGEKIFGFRKTFHEHSEARGVGLFLTKTQIETLGGTITIDSKEGVGTTFLVTF